MQNHLAKVKAIHESDLEKRYGEVYMPYALARKYPNAAREWGWQYVFPARNLSTDPRSGVIRRHHIDPSVINKAIKVAVRKAGPTKGSRKNKFTFLMDKLSSSNLAVRYMASTLFLSFSGQKSLFP